MTIHEARILMLSVESGMVDYKYLASSGTLTLIVKGTKFLAEVAPSLKRWYYCDGHVWINV